jgi:hypothetical protein
MALPKCEQVDACAQACNQKAVGHAKREDLIVEDGGLGRQNSAIVGNHTFNVSIRTDRM